MVGEEKPGNKINRGRKSEGKTSSLILPSKTKKSSSKGNLSPSRTRAWKREKKREKRREKEIRKKGGEFKALAREATRSARRQSFQSENSRRPACANRAGKGGRGGSESKITDVAKKLEKLSKKQTISEA